MKFIAKFMGYLTACFWVSMVFAFGVYAYRLGFWEGVVMSISRGALILVLMFLPLAVITLIVMAIVGTVRFLIRVCKKERNRE